MMKKKALILLFLSLIASPLLEGQDSSGSASAKRPINDYSMIGLSYGVTFSDMIFSPSKTGHSFIFSPNLVSLTYTKYSKMFGTLPYFGLVIGATMGNEGFMFKPNQESGYVNNADGAESCVIQVFEIPAMAQIHMDVEPAKIMANAGVYGGWRSSIERSGSTLDPAFTNSFKSYENRFDYGFQGGLGFGLMFDPIEIHFNCLVRWSWQSLYQPDYSSQVYYNYATPLDIMATVGIHFQITKRRGKTSKELRREAKEIVYGQQE